MLLEPTTIFTTQEVEWAGRDAHGDDQSCTSARSAGGEATGSQAGHGGGDAASVSGRTGLWVVVRCCDMGLVGERGTKVPNAAIGELSLELELSLALSYEYSRQAKPTRDGMSIWDNGWMHDLVMEK